MSKHYVLTAFVAAITLIPFAGVHAASQARPASVSATDAVRALLKGFDSLQYVKFDYKIALQATPSETADEDFVGSAVSTQGVAAANGDALTSGTYAKANSGRGVITKAEFARKGDRIFVRFMNPDVTALRKKWIAVAPDEFTQFGKDLGIGPLFEQSGVYAEGDESNAKDSELLDRYAVLVEDQAPELRRVKGRNVVSYSYIYNRATVAAYFKASKEVLRDSESSIFAIDGFEQGLNNARFLDELVEGSHLLVSIDYDTGAPVELVKLLSIPAFGSRSEPVIFASDMRWKPTNKLKKASIPSKTISTAHVRDLLGGS